MGHGKSGGFTLIELLVVISIVALLIAILLPSLGRAKTIAGQIKCLSGARQVNLAVTVYQTDNRLYFPANMASPTDPTNWATGPLPEKNYGYHNVLVSGDYIGKALFTNKGCPHGPVSYTTSLGDCMRVGVIGYPPVNSYGLLAGLQGGYGKPGHGNNTAAGPSWAYYGQQKTSLGRISRYPNMSVVITCHGAPGDRSSDNISFARGLLHLVGHDSDPATSWAFPNPAYARHDGLGIPMSMADGHGQVTPVKQIWDDRDAADGTRPYKDPTSVMYYSFTHLYDLGTYSYDN
jgi:prepilin-type N-terminal cleavage/methylation domain-containing protein